VPAAGQPDTPPAGAQSERPQRRVLGILPYRKNYVLPITYNANVNTNLPDEPSFELPLSGEDALDDVEMKFQISFEVPLWTRILSQPLDLYFGYIQLAFFQAYNAEYSSPFRETNYEPEVGLHWLPDLRIGTQGSNWRLASMRVAANHQSNGRAEPLSRSWNRLTGEATIERGDLTLGLRLWTLLGANPPDNPDIEDYLGYGEMRASYDLGRHRLGAMLRSVEHPTVQLDWSYPLSDRVRVYAQYFNGYGESLLDYDHSVNRIGAGFLLEDGR
jgi:phospholipase A1